MNQPRETMSPRERVRRTLRFETPDRVPRNLWRLPGIQRVRPRDLEDVLRRWPEDIVHAPITHGSAACQRGEPGRKGVYVDAWGCVWEAKEEGVIGEVIQAPLADWAAMKHFKPPVEVLQGMDLSAVNPFVAQTNAFVLAGSEVYPFERLQFLRGTENLLVDLAYGTAELFKLIDMLHGFYLLELSKLAATDVDAISFRDDWGSQQALLIHPEAWRRIFKPLYAEYCKLIHGAGKFVFYHSDGQIEAIYEDLVEIGIDAINSQLFCMDIESLGRKYKGRITFWGEIDRQRVLPFGTRQDVFQAVRRVYGHLYDPSGGVVAQCEFGLRDPKENIAAVFEAWQELTSKNLKVKL